jgi:hypothetical protein
LLLRLFLGLIGNGERDLVLHDACVEDLVIEEFGGLPLEEDTRSCSSITSSSSARNETTLSSRLVCISVCSATIR